jgi:hypothetical protein
VDSRYQDLMDDPLAVLRELYARLDMPCSAEVEGRMRVYLESKPRGKFGRHRYAEGDAGLRNRERTLFRAYQARYGVPDEN